MGTINFLFAEKLKIFVVVSKIKDNENSVFLTAILCLHSHNTNFGGENAQGLKTPNKLLIQLVCHYMMHQTRNQVIFVLEKDECWSVYHSELMIVLFIIQMVLDSAD